MSIATFLLRVIYMKGALFLLMSRYNSRISMTLFKPSEE